LGWEETTWQRGSKPYSSHSSPPPAPGSVTLPGGVTLLGVRVFAANRTIAPTVEAPRAAPEMPAPPADSTSALSGRSPVVETAKQENIIPVSVGLPDWLKKRVVLRFETRIIRHPGEDPYVVLICGNRLRTVIDVDCAQLNDIGVPLLGSYVSTWTKDLDPKLSKRLRLAGRVVANDGTILQLSDHGDGPAELRLESAYLEPTRANFNAVVQALVQGKADRVLKDVQEAEGGLREGNAHLKALQSALEYFGRVDLEIADGVKVRLGELLDQSAGLSFPPAEVFPKPSFSFDPSGSRDDTWTQRQLDATGPYDRATFERKRPRIAVICEARRRGDVAETVAHFLEGLPNIKSHKGLVPHGTGLVGRRGGGERVVGITTVFSSQGNYLLDARTAAVPFEQYPTTLRETLVAAVERVRKEEAWHASDTVRLIFHAFTQLQQETADAVVAAVAGMGLTEVRFAFLHVAEDHPYTLFDHASTSSKGAFAPDRGQAVELTDHEWLLTLTGRDQVRATYQGIPDPVLLRLHEKSTFRDMRSLAKRVRHQRTALLVSQPDRALVTKPRGSAPFSRLSPHRTTSPFPNHAAPQHDQNHFRSMR